MASASGAAERVRGLRDFMLAHESCVDSLDLHHEADTVVVLCRACGETFRYQREPGGQREPAHPRPTKAEGSVLDEEPITPASISATPPTHPLARGKPRSLPAMPGRLVIAGIFGAIAIIGVVAGIRALGGEGDEGLSRSSSAQPGEAPSHGTPTSRGDQADPRQGQGRGRNEPRAEGNRGQKAPEFAMVGLQTGTFEIPLTRPKAWKEENGGDHIAIVPRDGAGVEIQVYADAYNTISIDEMATRTSALLKARKPDVRLSDVLDAPSGPAVSIRGRYRAGVLRAVLLVSGTRRFLVIGEIDRNAPPGLRQKANATLASLGNNNLVSVVCPNLGRVAARDACQRPRRHD